jgi:hypothetical protein
MATELSLVSLKSSPGGGAMDVPLDLSVPKSARNLSVSFRMFGSFKPTPKTRGIAQETP